LAFVFSLTTKLNGLALLPLIIDFFLFLTKND